jgi:Undecaprenyl-phosphate galactose phosphotransferase WbaP
VLEGAPYGETVAGAMDLARKQGIGTAVFAMPQVRSEQLSRFVGRASLIFPYIVVIPNLNGTTTSAVIARDLGGTLGLEIKHNLLNPWAQRLKRAMDIGCVVVGGALILPFLLVLSLFVWLERRGPILYWDLRMGKDANTFWCVKFRTMVDEADAELQRLLEENSRLREEYLEYHKLRVDPRITPVGKFLRKTSLDELPQLWNVLRGEMSLVGPRPYKPRESEVVGLSQDAILRVRPGITGLWQVSGRNSITFKQRIQMDVYYVRNWSIWLDLVVLIRTAETVVFRRGAA